jgi:predicted metal-dependent hydrolase
VRLFNAQRYHDAHEAFERLWLATTGPDSDFYKGLIQASIAMHHTQEGNVEGARKLYGGHRRLLAAYLPEHRGLDVAGLLAEMQRSLRPLLRSENVDLATPPRISPSTPA